LVTLSSPEIDFEWQSFVGVHPAPVKSPALADDVRNLRQTWPTAARRFLHSTPKADNGAVSGGSQVSECAGGRMRCMR